MRLKGFFCLFLLLPTLAIPDAASLEFLEAFAWGDRTEALNMLVPGTENAFYFTCLHHELEGDLEAFDRTFDAWKADNGNRWTSRMHELHRRRMLSAYHTEPDRTWDFLRRNVGHGFNHQPLHQRAERESPSRLRPEQVSLKAFLRQAQGRNTVREFTDLGLELAMQQNLNDQERRELLGRLRRPDMPGVVDMILKDLQVKDSRGFGHHALHRLLTRDQLVALADQRPSLLENRDYVNQRLARILPSPGDISRDHEGAVAYYRDMWEFVKTLGPVHTSLKAATLYQLLDHQRHLGTYDEALFKTYLSLPRPVGYLQKDLRGRYQRQQTEWVNFAYQPGGSVVLPAIGNEEPLVRDYLIRLLKDDATPHSYSQLFEQEWLGRMFAESKLLAGEGEPSQWARFLKPAQYREILERVEVNLALDNPSRHLPGDPVSLAVEIKNVDRLMVKIFEIHPFNYYRSTRAPVDQAVDLEGLVPTHERSLDVSAASQKRVRHQLDLPEISERGIYVVELIGNGVSSRALLQLGHLEAITQPTEHGLVMMVLNEKGATVHDARVWLEGQEFESNEKGLVLLPFSENPGTRFVILRDGDFASPDQIEHPGEAYAFSAGIHVDKQSLVRRTSGVLLLRPDLRLNGFPVSLNLLKDVKVILTAVDAKGTPSEQHFTTDFEANREWVRPFYVPEGLRKVEVSVSATLTRKLDGEDIELSDATSIEVNQARTGDTLKQVYLVPTSSGWILEVRGLNGEVLSGESLELDLVHPAFTDTVDVDVTTDRDGRVTLGHLTGLSRLRVSGNGLKLDASLDTSWAVLPDRLHLLAGQKVSLPYATETSSELKTLSFLKVANGIHLEDVHDKLQVSDGELVIEGVSAGTYLLTFHDRNVSTLLDVVDGENRSGFLVGNIQRLQKTDTTLPSVAEIQVGKGRVELKLRHVSPSTRVAVRAARFLGDGLSVPPGLGFAPPAHRDVIPPYAQYVSGRQLGDEIRYVLERQTRDIFAGTLLQRPGLILNPWELRDTTADQEVLKADEAYTRSRQAMNRAVKSQSARAQSDSARRYSLESSASSIGVDFLPEGSRWWVNLRPDEDGRIRIPLEGLDEHTQLEIAVMDRSGTSIQRQTLSDRSFEPREVRLESGLDPDQAFSRQKSISALDAGETLTFEDLSTTRFKTLQTVEDLFGVLSTLSDDPQVEKFSFLARWPDLDRGEKFKKLHEFASHELHVFLSQRDPDFFREAVAPVLKNKLNKTFVDRWLLDELTEEDLTLDRLMHRNALELALLARKSPVSEVAEAILNDTWELLPPDPEGFNRTVQTALQAGGLDPETALRLEGQKKMAREVSSSIRELRSFGGGRGSGGDPFGAPAPSAPALESVAEMDASLSLDVSADEMDDRVSVLTEGDPFGFGGKAPRLYRALPKTKEWAEQNYYQVRLTADTPGRLPVNAFWLDVARGTSISSHVLLAHRNLTDVVGALAFSGLPFSAEAAKEEMTAPSLQLRVSSPAILVAEQILPAEPSDDDRPLLISQQIFRPDDRYRYEENEQIEKFVTGEFVRRTVYGARVTLTNPTASKRRLNLLVQVPLGSIPVRNGRYTEDVDVELGSYTTKTVEVYFTFPASGTFSQFPPHAAEKERTVGRVEPSDFRVVDAPTAVDRSSWDWVSQHAENQDVLTFLENHNLQRLDLDKIAWRLKDVTFFSNSISLLKSRGRFHDTTFSYGIWHRDESTTHVWLANSALARQVGPAFVSPLLTVNPVVEKSFEHLEYAPLVNPRAHEVGDKRVILNQAQRNQYQSFLNHQMYLPELTPEAHLVVMYHLQLQDRLPELKEQLADLDVDSSEQALQVAYLKAWMAMRELRVNDAISLAGPFSDTPNLRWRERFRDLIAQAGRDKPEEGIDPDRQKEMDALAGMQPSLKLEMISGALMMTSYNIPEVMVNLYPMDIENLFSRTPFLADGGEGFSVIRPSLQITVPSKGDGTPQPLSLPAEMSRQNVIVEISGRGQSDSLARLANDLRVRKMEAFGQLEVRHADGAEPLPKTYVKVFARDTRGNVSFWKDGYTDLRGRFDYLSLNNRKPEEAAELSILLLHPEHGAEILQATPPVR